MASLAWPLAEQRHERRVGVHAVAPLVCRRGIVLGDPVPTTQIGRLAEDLVTRVSGTWKPQVAAAVSWRDAGVGLGCGMVHPAGVEVTEHPAEPETGLTLGVLSLSSTDTPAPRTRLEQRADAAHLSIRDFRAAYHEAGKAIGKPVHVHETQAKRWLGRRGWPATHR